MNAGYPQSAPARTRDELNALDRIDVRVRDLAVAIGAREMQYPALIAREVLEQAEYPRAFPHLLMSASRNGLPEHGDTGQPGSASPIITDWCLSPAVCYHTYAQLARRVLEAPVVITARGRCFRAERDSAPGIRQIEFEMREIVLLGAPAWIDASAEMAKLAIETVGREAGLGGDWEVAEDPFFLPAAAGKALMQRLLKVKLEYQWPGVGGIALASINRHGAFFGRRFDISTPDGTPVHTMCIAVGLDRWAHHAHGSASPAGQHAPQRVRHNEEVTP
jgi:seryl-tRNA synthetase